MGHFFSEMLCSGLYNFSEPFYSLVSYFEVRQVTCPVEAEICWKYALEAIIKALLLYFLVHDNCLLFMP